MNVNALYLGMSCDIMSPLVLIPNMSKLWAIDLNVNANNEDIWLTTKNEIKQILIDGSDVSTIRRQQVIQFSKELKEEIAKDDSDLPKFYNQFINADNFDELHYLKSKCDIISEVEDDSVWTLTFKYDTDDHIIELIYYHHRNFLEVWPHDIQNISCMVGIGAFNFGWDEENNKIMSDIMKDRIIKPLTLYDSGCLEECNCNTCIDPNTNKTIVVIKNGNWRHGSEVRKLVFV